jgi:Raf kinase inhibitor-like YbhB/YbcL family protein
MGMNRENASSLFRHVANLPPVLGLHSFKPAEAVVSGSVPRARAILSTAATLGAATLVLVACNDDGRTLRPAKPSQTQSVYTPTTTTTIAPQSTLALDAADGESLAFVLSLPWVNNGSIDPRYTCAGDDVQPQVSWFGAPAEAVEMALVVTDPDADNFVHWVIAGLDPQNTFIAENNVPIGAIEGANDFSTASTPDIGWRGPCPPAGAPHHYVFTLYALDQQVELPTGSPASEMQAVIDGAAIEAAQLTGVYETP